MTYAVDKRVLKDAASVCENVQGTELLQYYKFPAFMMRSGDTQETLRGSVIACT